MNTAVDRIVNVFQTLTPAGVETLDTIYAPDARFKDPFNDVRGLAEIARIFRHMYVNLENPRFIITERIEQDAQCFLSWEFHFAFRRFRPGQPQCILGGSHLMLDDDGRITLHRDYWDAAEELYEKLPLIGSLMRWLKKRSNS
ncbi:MAG: nuclear transport factor 2 family protein [Rhodoferax sp.]|nr:nuclear transport factor 2 family protein [Rhodoferax sp.]